jgi:hypothetical protein
MKNYEISNVFYQIADLLEIKGENPLKKTKKKESAKLIILFENVLHKKYFDCLKKKRG